MWPSNLMRARLGVGEAAARMDATARARSSVPAGSLPSTVLATPSKPSACGNANRDRREPLIHPRPGTHCLIDRCDVVVSDLSQQGWVASTEVMYESDPSLRTGVS